MTYREKIKETNPELIDGTYAGGVNGCPGNYFKGAPGGCRDWNHTKCSACWDTELLGFKTVKPKKAETLMKLIEKAFESNDKSVHILVQPDGTISVNIIPFAEEKEEAEVEDEPAEIEGWYEIEYGIDKRGMRVITKNEPPEYMVVNVYCPEKDRVFAAFWSRFRHAWTVAGWSTFTDEPAKAELKTPVTHWMSVPEAPKKGE